MSERELENQDLWDKLWDSFNILIKASSKAIDEVKADNEQEVMDSLKNLSKNNDKFFNESIEQLKNQILDWTTWTERLLLEKQIIELQEIDILYKRYLKEKMTRSTNVRLDLYFNQVRSEITIQSPIEDDKEEIQKIIDDEDERKEDSLWDSSYRDLIEKSLSMKGRILESVNETDKVENFYNLFTIEYINILESISGEKTPIKSIRDNWLDITEKQLNQIISKVIQRGKLTLKDIDFDIIEFTLNWNKEISIDVKEKLQKVEKSIRQAVEKERNKVELIDNYYSLTSLFNKLWYKVTYTKKEISEIKNKIETLESEIKKIKNKEPKQIIKLQKEIDKLNKKLENINNADELVKKIKKESANYSKEELRWLLIWNEDKKNMDTFKYWLFIEVFWFSHLAKETLDYWLTNHIQNRTIIIKWKNIRFTKEYINENKEVFMHNLKTYFWFMMAIESFWWELNSKKNTYAHWPLQWVDWYSNWKLVNNGQQPFKTAKNRAGNYYKWWETKVTNKPLLLQYIEEDNKNNLWKLNIKQFQTEKQIALWFPDAIMRKWKALKLLMWIMVWDIWSAKQYYLEIHNWETIIKSTSNKKKKKITKITQKHINTFFPNFKQIN